MIRSPVASTTRGWRMRGTVQSRPSYAVRRALDQAIDTIGRVKALDGIRVVDLTHALAGPFCTYHLQLLGAEVIKIERPGVGDDFRDFARLPDWEVSPSFVAVNGGKRSITIDLKHAEGQEIVRRLATRADV